MSERKVYWSHWSLQLIEGNAIVHAEAFPVGPHGPADGAVGSPERAKFERMANDWIECAILPAPPFKF